MPVTVYSSVDANGPGQMANTAGALIAVLDACLVNGYSGKSAAGWTKPYSSGTTLAVYKQGTGGSNRYLRVDDALAGYSRVVGYEDMTDVNTGTAPFPTAAQLSGGGYWHKHNGDAGTRPWFVIADSKSFYFWSQYSTATSGVEASFYFFGDTKSLKPADGFSTMLMAADGTTKTAAVQTSNDHGGAVSALNIGLKGHFMVRSYTGAGSSIVVGKHAESFRINKSGCANLNSYGYAWLWSLYTTANFPSPVDASMTLAPIIVHETPQVDRAFMPGLWTPAHIDTVLGNTDTFTSNAGVHNGKSFLALRAQGGMYTIETSDTWWS